MRADWVRSAERLPELRPTDDDWLQASEWVLAFVYPDGSPEHQREQGYTLISSWRSPRVLCLEQVSGGVVEWCGDEISFRLDAVTHWMSLPEMPERNPESLNVERDVDAT